MTAAYELPPVSPFLLGTYATWPSLVEPPTGTCPDCGGRGETTSRPTRDPETGAWDENAATCGRCSGSGLIDLTRCEGLDGSCAVTYDAAVEGCQHGEPFCEGHRMECADCRADRREDLDELARHEDPWGGVR